ncbi:hypothetical protein AMQ84_22665 [Paenibacillus riograndensis]|uniref:PKD domain-containing protein n=1 Tax=Paenibacillus riograndensis TaxID=483937 RepID=A0A132TQI7_9BACL|nr:hypothetical protein AMQ84_22665 [Paenibacillus riograndensis]
MKRLLKESIILFLCFALLLPFLPRPALEVVGLGTVAQAAEDDIIYYRDITFEAGQGSHGNQDNAITLDFPALKVINLKYNKITKRLTYDIAPGANLRVHLNSSYGTERIMTKMCSSIYTKKGYEYERMDQYGEDQSWFCRENPYSYYDDRYWPADFGNLYSFVPYEERYKPYVDFDLSNIREKMKVTAPNTYFQGSNDIQEQDIRPGLAGDPELFRIRIVVHTDFLAGDPYGVGYTPAYWTPYMTRTAELIPNHPPSLSVGTPNGITLVNAPNLSGVNIEGYVSDPDNEDVTVTAEIPNVFYKKTVVPQAKFSKNFSIPIDAVQDSLPPGAYTMNITASDPSGMTAKASLTINVKQQMRNKSFVLVNTPVETKTKFFDSEGDAKHGERYRFDHDPYFFDNSMDIIGDSGLWRSSVYSSFPYSGVYVATFQGRDNPINDDRFDVYRKWSRDNLSSMTFHVHRKPIALFSAKLMGGMLQITDSSYDLDHITASNKGLMDWQWQYKKTEGQVWTDGFPPAQLPGNDQYDIRLRVRDVDGENGAGVWSDWSQQTVGAAFNLPPVALFTVEPSIVSYRKATTIRDKSFDPDNDPLDVYNWSVIKDGWQQVWSHWGGATTPPNIAAYGVGTYQLTLKVHDNRGLWSEPYSQTVQVINHPPAAAFSMPTEVYRDTVIIMENMTPDPDQDGDVLSYAWNAKINNSPYYYSGGNRNQVMTIRDLIARSGITQQQAISDGWEMRLTASDGTLSSNATRNFTVLNHVPTAAINGPATVYQFDTKQYTSSDNDGDPSDMASLQYFWKVTDSDGATKLYKTPSIEVSFPNSGIYTLEHWAVDQIGAKSNIDTLKVNVLKNLAPSMTITSPAGTSENPSVLDAEKQGDPLIEWTYSDPENDSQEKYRLEFFTKEGILEKSVENADNTGLIRQYQVPNPTFNRFEYFTVLGRAYSKGSWSEISNEKMFIIDNPPKPGFSLLTDTGKDATKVPIYRTDILNIKSTAADLDEPKGDTISYKYTLKPENGTEGPASTQGDFTKKFVSNGIFTYRQVVTDSLGLFREITHSLTVVNRLPKVNITYPTSDNQNKPTIVSTLTPIIKWDYQDEDGDQQQRYKVRIINLTTGAVTVQSGEQVSSAKQWQVPASALAENQKYAVEMEVYDGFDWSAISPRKYFMVNLLTVKGGVKHTEEWNTNRQAYNLKQSGDPESPRAYNVYWAGEAFVLQAKTTGLPDTVQVTMTGGYTTQLTAADSDKLIWDGQLTDPSFEKLPNGPVTFTFTATNEYQTKVDTVTVVISEDWTEYFRSHRIK